MLWTVRYEWPCGAQFTLNCYHHWETLVVCDADGSGHFLHSKEDMTQGGPPATIAYVIGILPRAPRALQHAPPSHAAMVY